MRSSSPSTRRDFLTRSGIAVAGLLTGRCSDAATDLDAFIHTMMDRDHIPGLAVAIFKDRQTVWSKGFGWADIQRRVEMTQDTVQNIGSISKTFVGTAVMQLRERGLLQLEDDVNKYLDFSVRNPGHPQSPITFSDLMVHRSSIADGSAYARGYACGDPAISLEKWIRGYFLPGGAFNDPKENFHPWAPGERGREYSNVAFGLLARLVEVISGMSFSAYCRTRIFQPLGMDETSWYLADVNGSRQAIPYSYVSGGSVRGPSQGGSALGVIGATRTQIVMDGYAPNCFYNHPNFPDGFLRTSVHQLSQYLIAYLKNGSVGGYRILSEDSIDEMLRSRYAVSPEVNQGLVWTERVSDRMWGHGGGDPGINTLLRFDRSSGSGVIIFGNTWGVPLVELEKRLFQEIGTL